jgi:hypothetical protein
VKNLLSINVNTTERHAIHLCQGNYIKEILRNFNMEDCKGLTTVLSSDYKSQDESAPKFDEKLYRSATGSLLHLANCTRPDIAFSVSVLCQKNHDPNTQDWINVKHLIRYLKKTENLGICYKKTGCKIQAYVDADWASDQYDRRSTTGFVVCLANAPISWKSKKQQTVALSTNEAEYIALSEAAREVLYFKGLLTELNLSEYVSGGCQINVDNQGAISFAKNNTCTDRSKYIDTKYHFVREEISKGRLKLQYVPSKENVADVFTKVLSGVRTEELVSKMGLINLNDN